MKRFKVLKKSICILGLMVLMVRSTFALGPGDSHVKKNVAVIGDSYAGYFMLSESNIGFDFYTFPVGGITNEVNINSFLNCIENGNNDIIVFMTGVNDYLKNTSLKDYENTLKLFVERAKAKNKFIWISQRQRSIKAEGRLVIMITSIKNLHMTLSMSYI